ncbi:MAG: porin [Bacteroidota bacterium]|nr:porin [Bacteroidota bacterium]
MKQILVTILIVSIGVAGFGQSTLSPDSSGWQSDGKFVFRSEDDNFKMQFDIRMYMDAAMFFNDTDELFSSGTHLRKARFASKANFWGNWQAEWDMDIAEYEVEIKDMWLAYNWENSMFKMGHYKVPFGLETLTSSRLLTFMERSYISLAFKMGRRTSVGYSLWGSNWYATTVLFAQGMDDDKNQVSDETGNGFALRAAYGPQFGQNAQLHFGGALSRYAPNDERGIIDFNAEPETKMGDMETLDTDNIRYVEMIQQAGLEGAFQLNNIILQGEYAQTDLSRETGYTDATFSGGYALLSWIITGEKKPWKNDEGEFGALVPNNQKYGAWELALRFSNLNLSDPVAEIYGGKANNYTAGLNWYTNPNVRFMLNYTMVDNSVASAVGDYDFSYVQFRTLVTF